MKVIGVDLGGTQIKIGLVDYEKKKIVKKVIKNTPKSRKADEVIKVIVEGIKEVINSEKICAVGIGSPGSIDVKRGVVRFSPNFSEWNNIELGPSVERLTGLKTVVENDANSFVLGEWYFGKGMGAQHIVALTLGTGIGGGVVSHGVLITGKNGIGAELGHFIVDPNGPLCGCGNRGCIEAIASASSVARFAKELSRKSKNNLILKLAGNIENIEAKHVFDALKEGCRTARFIVDKITDALARAIAGYVHIFNPEKIILGGGMSKAGNLLLDPLKEKVEFYVMPSFRNTYEILISDLKENAGIFGAASSAIYRLNLI